MVRLSLPVLMVLTGAACASLFEDRPELPRPDDPCATWPDPGTYALTVPGFSRKPLVYVPDTAGPRDAVVMLHGAGSTADRIRGATRFAALATGEGFVAVYPNGTGTLQGYTWNAGSCCGYADQVQIDDVGFLDAMTAELRDRTCADRVLGVGHSNGSMMIHRWTCEGEGPDAAFGTAGPLLLDTCEGDPAPVTAWHGTDDAVVPLEGGDVGDGVVFPDAREAFARVRARNGCDDTAPTVERVGDTTCETWSCDAPTTFCTLDGWPHRWPGGDNDREESPVAERWALDWFAGLDVGMSLPGPDDTGATGADSGDTAAGSDSGG